MSSFYLIKRKQYLTKTANETSSVSEIRTVAVFSMYCMYINIKNMREESPMRGLCQELFWLFFKLKNSSRIVKELLLI
jgi:hypothetical protein